MAKVVPPAGSQHWYSKSHPVGTDFEDIKGSRRAAEAWHCARPGEVTGEGASLVAGEGPELKGSCREVGAWHLRRQSMRGYW